MKTILILVVALFVFSGCSEIAQLTTTSHDLAGNVILCDENGELSNYAGVAVTIEGSGQSVTTDPTGNWSIKGVADQTQTIAFSKDGFGTFKKVLHLEGANPNYQTQSVGTVKMYGPASFHVVTLSADMVSGGVQVSGVMSSKNLKGNRYVMLFIGTDIASADPEKYVALFYFEPQFGDSLFSGEISTSDLYRSGIPVSSTIFIVAYTTYTPAVFEKYADENTGSYIYPYLSTIASPKISVKLP